MKPELATNLEAAARLIRTAAERLDRREQPCDHCGTNRKLNWNEWQMATELDAIIRKLRNFAKKLSHPANP